MTSLLPVIAYAALIISICCIICLIIAIIMKDSIVGYALSLLFASIAFILDIAELLYKALTNVSFISTIYCIIATFILILALTCIILVYVTKNEDIAKEDVEN